MNNLRSFYVAQLEVETPICEIIKKLESSNIDHKLEGMEKLLRCASNQNVLMTVLKYVAGQKHKLLTKLLHLYLSRLDIADTEDFSLLVGQVLRNELTSPNEYVRGSCLRSLCRYATPQYISPVKDCVLELLSDQFEYVRRNACLFIANAVNKFYYEEFDSQLNPILVALITSDSSYSVRATALRALAIIDPTELYAQFIVSPQITASGNEQLDRAFIYSIGQIYMYLAEGGKMNTAALNAENSPYENLRAVYTARQHASLNSIVSMDVLVHALAAILTTSKNAAVQMEAVTTSLWLSTATTHTELVGRTLLSILQAKTDPIIRQEVVSKLEDINLINPSALRPLAGELISLGNVTCDLYDRLLTLVVSLADKSAAQGVMVHLYNELVNNRHDSAGFQNIILWHMRKVYSDHHKIGGEIVERLVNFVSTSGSYNLVLFIRETIIDMPVVRLELVRALVNQLIDVAALDNSSMFVQLVYTIQHAVTTPEARDYFINTIYNNLAPYPLSAPATSPGAETASFKTIVRKDGRYDTVKCEQSDLSHRNNSFRTAVASLADQKLVTSLSAVITRVLVSDLTYVYDSPNAAVVVNQAIAILAALVNAVQKEISLGPNSFPFRRLTGQLQQILTKTKLPPRQIPRNLRASLQKEQNLTMVESSLSKPARRIVATIKANDLTYFDVNRGIQYYNPTSLISCATVGPAMDDLSSLYKNKWHNWSGYSEELFTELKYELVQTDLSVVVSVYNTTPNAINDINFIVSTDSQMTLEAEPESFSLPSHQSYELNLNFRINSTEGGNIYATVLYETVRGAAKSHIALQPFDIDYTNLFRRSYMNIHIFRKQWEILAWEQRMKMNVVSSHLLPDLFSLILLRTRGCVVGLHNDLDLINKASEHSSEQDETAKYYIDLLLKDKHVIEMFGRDTMIFNIRVMSLFNDDALINIAIDLRNNKIEVSVRIRAKSEKMALKIGEIFTGIERELRNCSNLSLKSL